MCVAYSRPKTLGNIFIYHKIDRLDGPFLLFGEETGDQFFFLVDERESEEEIERKREIFERDNRR